MAKTSTLAFDHAYCADPGYSFMRRLEKLGFLRDAIQVEHPGRQFCRFITFRGDQTFPLRYLEFIHLAKGGQKVECSGLSLSATSPLVKFQKRLQKQKIKSQLSHKNYAWKKDAVSRLPGWNFITFKDSMKGIFLWLTEYEDSPERRRRRKIPRRHPNGVTGIVGLELSLNLSGRNFLGEVLGWKDFSKIFTLACGTRLYASRGRSNRLTALVLSTSRLESLGARARSPIEVWRGSEAVRLRNPDPLGWDLLVVGR